MQKKLMVVLVFFLFIAVLTGNNNIVKESKGIEIKEHSQKDLTPDPVAHARALRNLPEGGLLLIPESSNDRVMAFDPQTGDLVDENFIPADEDHLSTPIEAILSSDENSILVSDQIDDVVQQYDLDGNYLGVFAPAGGVNNDILDNVRGICYHENGDLLVSNSGGANADCVARFDADGNHIGNFVANGETDPFDVYYRSAVDDYLVCDISSGICRYGESYSGTGT